MGRIQVKGFVPDNFKGNEFSLRIEDSQAIERFYIDEKIDTGLRYADGYPIISVRGNLASKCKPGNQALLTIETHYKDGKIGIKNIDIEILKSNPNKATKFGSGYAVITQNDESAWDDVKGDLYHYPSTYQSILTPGCRVIYYKGKIQNKEYAADRLSPLPHYFGIGVVGDSILDPSSKKKDRYCEILDYQEFEDAVLAKIDSEYLEDIPESRRSNYWRFGVREISREVYDRICGMTRLAGYIPKLPHPNGDFESFKVEGAKKARFTTYYERIPLYREKAIAIHGLACMACGMDFEAVYGEWGAGFIHVHHNKPVSESGPTRINPTADLSVVCPNCHAMIHRKKETTLTVEGIKELLQREPDQTHL